MPEANHHHDAEIPRILPSDVIRGQVGWWQEGVREEYASGAAETAD